MKALILCAGMGNRLKPHTLKLAKPAIPFLGVPMMAYSLFYLESLGLTDFTINTHHLPNTVEQAAKNLVNPKHKLNFSFEPKIQDSAGGISAAKKFLQDQDDFIVSNGDCVFLFEDSSPLHDLIQQHKDSKAIASFLVLKHKDAGVQFNALWADEQMNFKHRGLATDLKDSTELNPYHYFGLAVYNQRIFNYLPENKPSSLFDDIIPKLVANKEVIKLSSTNKAIWFETGNPTSYNSAQKELKNISSQNRSYQLAMDNIYNRFHISTPVISEL
ncbi:MAG: NTP transferase domain-containing protein [Bdellovibrionaceae bacterium]|jgi:mannose-1-phosphate guanylyltransferase|nr:NTP transferase domain-containing protein [Pseudobdellovibrionaceae bacterium]